MLSNTAFFVIAVLALILAGVLFIYAQWLWIIQTSGQRVLEWSCAALAVAVLCGLAGFLYRR